MIRAVTTRVALLRAVNVGRRTVRNARLVELFEELGFTHVWTHVNSGNVVFDGSGRGVDLERRIGAAIEEDVGFEVTTFVRTAAELRKALELQPFALSPGDTYFVTFLARRPTAAQATALEELSNDFDTLVVDGRDVHWLMHGKSTDTKIATRQWERILGERSTTSRNTTMLAKLRAKIDAS